MKNPVQNKFTYLRKSIVSILASNAFKAAICTLLSLALFACSSDAPTEKSNEITDTEVNNPSQNPELPEVPDNFETPDTPENPDNPNPSTIPILPEDPEEPGRDPEAPGKPDEPQPDDPDPITLSEEEREAALKNIFGITETSEEMSDTITLTAQAIKVLGDISSGRYVEGIADSDIKAASDKTSDGYAGAITKLRDAYGIDVKNIDNKEELNYAITNGIIIRDENNYLSEQYRKITDILYLDSNGYINNPNGFYYSQNDPSFKNEPVPAYTIKSDEKVKLSGNFYYDEIHLNGNISADEATFTIKDYKKYIFSPEAILSLYNDLNGENINYQKILVENTDTKKGHKYTFPKMEFYLYDENYQNKIMDILTLMDLYVLNSKSDNIGFRNIAHDGTTNTFDGNKTENKKLFVENTQQPDLPNVSATTIVEAAKTHMTPNFKNLQITGEYNTTKSEDINARFTNVILKVM